MKQYLETICIRRGEPLRLDYHQARLNATLAAEGILLPLRLSSCVSQLPCTLRSEARIRCRVLYDTDGHCETSFHPYRLRTVQSLQCVELPTLEYSRKYADRSALDNAFALRNTADDILILRNGYLSDTTIANIALFDGRQWHTPSSALLAGTHRAALLREGFLRESPIHISELHRFSRIRLFNAMINWGEIDLPISAIRLPQQTP